MQSCFFDFVLEGGWDLLFPDDDEMSYECPFCRKVLTGKEKVEWIDRKNKIFKCPHCNKVIKMN